MAVGKLGCGQNSLWKQVLDLPVLGEVCPLGVVVSSNSRQQCSWRQLEAAGGIWKQQSQPSLPCMFEGLGLGEHCKLQGQGLTQDIDRLTINPVQGSWGC